MKINIFRQEEGKKFQISFSDVNGNGQEFGGSIIMDVEDVKMLNEMISKELQDLNKPEEEIVWNPKSQRHERVIKKVRLL